MNEQEYITTPIWDVIGIINGTIPDEVIVLGNHRDAWIAGGAGDPHSGSAALMEVIRSFGTAMQAGWRPLRTIVLASWDGEEYGLVGSTEWVEEYLLWLRSSAIAYINVDVGARGPYFDAAASPLLNRLIYHVTGLVKSPQGPSVRDTWDGQIRNMGSGSDFTAFQDFAGVSSLDVGFKPGPDTPVYHYHSNYDSFHWMERFGDPHWRYHVTMARILALLTASLSETPVIPFNVTDYAEALHRYIHNIHHDKFNFNPLEHAVNKFHHVATKFDHRASHLATQLTKKWPWWKWWKKLSLYYQVRKVNTKYKQLERQFLFSPGLDRRPWFKHVVFAPGRWTGYAGATLPGLVESFQDDNLTNADRWSQIIRHCVQEATQLLQN